MVLDPSSTTYQTLQNPLFKAPYMNEDEAIRIENEIGLLMENENETYGPFEWAVDPNVFPDYYTTVPVPMYVDLIRNRLLNRFYRQVDSLIFDVNQILSNCDMYNQEGADISVTAAEFIKKIHDIIRPSVGSSLASSSCSMSIEQPSSSSSSSSSYPASSGAPGSNPDYPSSGSYPDSSVSGLSSAYPDEEIVEDNKELKSRLSTVRQRENEVGVESNKRIRFSLSDKEKDDNANGLRLVINRSAKVAPSSSSGIDDGRRGRNQRRYIHVYTYI
jgi:hypothetical protein